MPERIVVTAEPCGFCSGVRNALALINEVLQTEKNVYILKGLIHNTGVTADLKKRGCIFVENVEDIPEGSVTIFGAHGVSLAVEQGAAARRLRVTDAACPLVKQLHKAAGALTPDRELVLFGHRGHPETEGVLGHSGTEKIFVVESADDVDSLPELKAPVLLVQTTLSHIEAEKVKSSLKKRFPAADISVSVCQASLLRQRAVERLAPECDLFVVAGSSCSSNANRLRETAERCGVRSVLIDDPAEVTAELLSGVRTIGLSAAASTPESQIETLRARLCSEEF